MRAICEDPPVWEPLIQGDLHSILAQALRKEPERRYLTLEQFSGDVRRYLAGLPVSARPDSVLYRARKFLVRRAVPVAAAAAVRTGPPRHRDSDRGRPRESTDESCRG
ncbi:MAG TPA: hypothetical protein VFD98_10640 [Terracidiphilus sp.]|nr:hypothetical protein [Terracidiphilus sp.]